MKKLIALAATAALLPVFAATPVAKPADAASKPVVLKSLKEKAAAAKVVKPSAPVASKAK